MGLDPCAKFGKKFTHGKADFLEGRKKNIGKTKRGLAALLTSP